MARSSITARIIEKDTGLRKLYDLAARLEREGAHVKVGVLEGTPAGDERREGGLTNAELAAVHEFGTADGHIPERSFLRSTFDANRAEYLRNMRTLLMRIVTGKLTVDQAFNILGAKIANDIKKRVTEGEPIPPPNAPSTIERKRRRGAWNGGLGAFGTIRTLIDTGRMIGSITWQVVRGK